MTNHPKAPVCPSCGGKLDTGMPDSWECTRCGDEWPPESFDDKQPAVPPVAAALADAAELRRLILNAVSPHDERRGRMRALLRNIEATLRDQQST